MTNDHSLIKDIFYLFQLFVLILFCTCFGYFCFSDSTDSNGQRLWVVWAIIFQLIWRRSWQTPNAPCIVQCLYVHLMHTPAPRKTHSPGQCITQVLIIHLVCTCTSSILFLRKVHCSEYVRMYILIGSTFVWSPSIKATMIKLYCCTSSLQWCFVFRFIKEIVYLLPPTSVTWIPAVSYTHLTLPTIYSV